ncbi:hypothetical protein DPQ22_01155 [Candidatus Tokpelaia sp.]|nr:hypothetical protein DPQ22_01155 [Candidatus Tokpelaia sp.]
MATGRSRNCSGANSRTIYARPGEAENFMTICPKPPDLTQVRAKLWHGRQSGRFLPRHRPAYA